MKNTSIVMALFALLAASINIAACHGSRSAQTTSKESTGEWTSLINSSLSGWSSTGAARWTITGGVLTGEGGRGHIYADPVLSNFEVRGEFRITDLGGGANSGLYFRANPVAGDENGFPQGYEAQICHNQEAFTGWLWKPGTPTGRASALFTKDGEWFKMRVIAMEQNIRIYVNDSLVTAHSDSEYRSGKFAIQCHNAGMKAEVRNLFYRALP